MVHPAVALTEAHRYEVAVDHLVQADGSPVDETFTASTVIGRIDVCAPAAGASEQSARTTAASESFFMFFSPGVAFAARTDDVTMGSTSST